MCFYVGRGQNNRAWTWHNRSKHHRSIVCGLLNLGLSVEVRIIKDGMTVGEADKFEIALIRDRRGEWLVNKTEGGGGRPGYKATPEEIEASRKARLGRRPTEEVRKRMSEARKGKVNSPETRAKISAANTGKKRGPYSDDWKKKQSLAKKGKKLPPEWVENIRRAMTPERKEIMRVGRVSAAIRRKMARQSLEG